MRVDAVYRDHLQMEESLPYRVVYWIEMMMICFVLDL